MASKRAIRRKSCGRKVRYNTQEEAKIAAGAAKHRTSDRIGWYKCGFCGFWHIGHTPYHVRNSIVWRV